MAAPQQLPCELWADETAIGCLAPDDPNTNDPCDVGPPVPATYPYTDEDYNRMASNILFQRTCREFPGECPVALRPCDPCRACGSCCTCHYEFIPLAGPYPVIEVTEVKIDGVVVDPAKYRVDEYIRLVRTDGELWPRWQDLSADPDVVAGSTFIIRYVTGRPIPVDLRFAAALLMKELKKACEGKACGLPDRVTTIIRDGVTYETIDAQEVALNGSFGIPLLDSLLASYPCDQKTKRPELTSRIMHPLLDGEVYNRRGIRS